MKHVALPKLPWGKQTPSTPLMRIAFEGRYTIKDMQHMAAALLQLSDENYEMRQRMIAMEMAIKASGAK